jgi:hypothetical protein
LPEAATLLAESTTYEAVLNKFFEWCNTTSDCAFQGQDLPTIFDTLVTNASLSPIPAPGCQASGACLANVTGEDILTNVQGDRLAGQGGVTSPPYWPALSQAIKEASEGNATLLSTALATSIVTPDGSYGRLAIGCQDWLHESKNLSDILAKTRMASVFAPHTKGQSQTHDYQVNCIGWPAPVTNPQNMPSKNLQKAPAMMLVNSLFDPEASITWATGMAAQVPKSVLVTRNGLGHTSYLLQGKTQKGMDKFLLTGVLPAKGTIFDS